MKTSGNFISEIFFYKFVILVKISVPCCCPFFLVNMLLLVGVVGWDCCCCCFEQAKIRAIKYVIVCVCVCSNISQCAMFQLFSDFFSLSNIFPIFF